MLIYFLLLNDLAVISMFCDSQAFILHLGFGMFITVSIQET